MFFIYNKKRSLTTKVKLLKIYFVTASFFTKEGGTMKEIIISIVSMQTGAFIGIATMCFFQINKGNSSSDKQ